MKNTDKYQPTAKEVADLRKLTGSAMMNCKKALIESNGDIKEAIGWIRQHGRVIGSRMISYDWKSIQTKAKELKAKIRAERIILEQLIVDSHNRGYVEQSKHENKIKELYKELRALPSFQNEGL